MARLFANNATSSLASGINDSDNTLLLAAGEGARFPAPTAGDHFDMTLTQGIGLEESWEIVKVTARSGDTLTVTRGQEGTTAAAWAAGSKAELRLTKGAMEEAATGTSATSDTTLTVSAGVKLLTIQEGKSFVPGMTVVVAAQSTPTTRMVGVVIEYAGTALTVDVRSTEGSGDYSAWIISITAADTPHTHDYLTDAPIDGKPYARQSGAWGEIDPKGESTLIRQVIKTSNYTLTLEDAGRHILHPGTDTTARTFTIPANASVPYEIGTAITFVNQNGSSGVVTIAITSDTMRLAGKGTTGSRTLARNGVATALKIAATEWIISGTGLT